MTALLPDFIHPSPATFNSVGLQNFSLPLNLIHRITENPILPGGLLKLQKSCKYFFAKNKIVFDNVYINQTKMAAPVFIPPNPSTFNSFKRHNFSLPAPLIQYILKNPISVKGLSKLQKSCKYFFANNKIIVIDRRIKYKPTYLFYRVHKMDYNYEEKFYFKDFKYWLTNDLEIEADYPFMIPESIYRCDLRNLIISEQNLTWKEMEFLLNGEKIIDLYLTKVNIRNENGNLLSCDRILSKVSKCIDLYYECCEEIFTNETFGKLNSIIFKSKFEIFDLFFHKFKGDINLSLLCDFIKKNANENSDMGFHFKMAEPQNYQTTLQSAVDEMLKSWETEKKPIIEIC